MKKVFLLFISALLLFGSFGNAFAGVVREPVYRVISGTCGNNVTWTLDTSSGSLTISGTGEMNDYSNQQEIPWRNYSDIIKKVVINSGVTHIGRLSFMRNEQLSSVSIPNTVTSIAYGAFTLCSSLKTITIPESVTTIGDWAFNGCALSSVFIPRNVSSIGSATFESCSSLTSIDADPNNSHFSSLDGVLFNKAGDELLKHPCGKSGKYTIPDSVVSLGEYAFYGCNKLTSVTFGNNVTSIGYAAFGWCTAMTSIVLSNTLSTIGEYAFSCCSALTSVTLPGSIDNIETAAFYKCTLLNEAVFSEIPPSSFGTKVFDYCADDFCICYYPEYASAWAPNGETMWNGYPICMIGGPDIEPGDLDGDGVTTMADVSTLSMFLNGENPEISASGRQAAYANGDGTVDIRDISAIYAMIANS